MKSFGYAAQSKSAPLAPWHFDRRDPGPTDVVVSIDFCGICHSDIHQARGEWGRDLFPMVPGHEIIGRVIAIGSDVKKFKVGDRAAVGVIVESCLHCDNCRKDLEVYCSDGGAVDTYNATLRSGERTYGGYADTIVTPEHFVHTLSPKFKDAALPAAAPLLCAGITTYSPLRHWGAGPGKKVGIVGLGGLGHLALKFAHAFGAHVVQFTTSASKIDDAKKLGADDVILTKDPESLKKHTGSFDFILDCVSAPHDMDALLGQLKLDGTLCLVGLPEVPLSVQPFSLLANRRSLAGSAIGGMKETQEMLDFCADHNIVADIEMTTYDKVNEAYERVVKGDVKYRFVLDNSALRQR
ncbi:MAG TPA: NAD(P)-dependent alcohol dehydrogenase [Acidobacteriaceae bacterium]|nr:NAD(P)-dependent alcohol dehydrogenase [Acidobacteriaceae bacterium]